MLNNQRGEITTIAVILIAVASVILTPLLLKNGNPFDRSADPANRRTASEVSGRDIVEITKAVAASEEPVTVHIDRSVNATSEVTDPKLTIGQRIGRFFGGLGTWAILLLIGGLALGIITPAGLLWNARNAWKSAFKNTVAGVRKIPDEMTLPCPHCQKSVTFDPYGIAVTEIEKKQDRRDAVLVDRVKSELH